MPVSIIRNNILIINKKIYIFIISLLRFVTEVVKCKKNRQNPCRHADGDINEETGGRPAAIGK